MAKDVVHVDQKIRVALGETPEGLHRRTTERNEVKCMHLLKQYLDANAIAFLESIEEGEPVAIWLGNDSSPQAGVERLETCGMVRRRKMKTDVLSTRCFIFSKSRYVPLLDQGQVLSRKTTQDIFAAILSFLEARLGEVSLRAVAKTSPISSCYCFDRGCSQVELLHRCMVRAHASVYEGRNFSFENAVYSNEELERTDYILKSSCNIHDLMNASHAGCEDEISIFTQKRKLSVARGVSKSCVSGLPYLLKAVQRTFKPNLTYAPYDAYDSEAYAALLKTMRVPRETIHHLVKAGLQFHPSSNTWSVHDLWRGNNYVIETMEMLIQDMMRFSCYSLSRWLSVGSSAAVVICTCLYGLPHLVKVATANLPGASFELATFRKYYDGNLMRFYTMCYLISVPGNEGVGMLLTSDQMIARHAAIRSAMHEAENAILNLPVGVFRILSEDICLGAIGVHELMNGILEGLTTSMMYAERVVFDPVAKSYPLKLASNVREGEDPLVSIRRNLNKLKSIPTQAELALDGTTRKVLEAVRFADVMGDSNLYEKIVQSVALWRRFPCSLRMVEQAHAPMANFKRMKGWNIMHLMWKGFGVHFQSLINKFEAKSKRKIDLEEEKRVANLAREPTKFRIEHQLKNELAEKRRQGSSGADSASFVGQQRLLAEARARITLMSEQDLRDLQSRTKITIQNLLIEQQRQNVESVAKMVKLESEIANGQGPFSSFDVVTSDMNMRNVNLPKDLLLRYLSDKWSSITHEQALLESKKAMQHPSVEKACRIMEAENDDDQRVVRMPKWLEQYWRKNCSRRGLILRKASSPRDETHVLLRGERLNDKRALSFEVLKKTASDVDSGWRGISGALPSTDPLSLLALRDSRNTYKTTGKYVSESSLIFRDIDEVTEATATLVDGKVVLTEFVKFDPAFNDDEEKSDLLSNDVVSVRSKTSLPKASDPSLLWDSQNGALKSLIDSQELEPKPKKMKISDKPLTTFAEVKEARRDDLFGLGSSVAGTVSDGASLLNRLRNVGSSVQAGDFVRNVAASGSGSNDLNSDVPPETNSEAAMPKKLPPAQRAAVHQALDAERKHAKETFSSGDFSLLPLGGEWKVANTQGVHDWEIVALSPQAKEFLVTVLKIAQKPKFCSGKTKTAEQAKKLGLVFRDHLSYLFGWYCQGMHLEVPLTPLAIDPEIRLEFASTNALKSSFKRIENLYEQFKHGIVKDEWGGGDDIE